MQMSLWNSNALSYLHSKVLFGHLWSVSHGKFKVVISYNLWLNLEKNFTIRSEFLYVEFLYVEFDLKEILILTEGYFNLMTQISIIYTSQWLTPIIISNRPIISSCL